MAEDKNKTTGSHQESNQNWDDQNDQERSGTQQPNPERYKAVAVLSMKNQLQLAMEAIKENKKEM